MSMHAAVRPIAFSPRQRKERFENAKLEKRLCAHVGRAIADFNMIGADDHVMVCVSGGKDSYALLEILLLLQARAPVSFRITAVNLDQKQPGFPAHVLPDYLARRGVPFRIEEEDTYSIVKRVIPEGKTTCSLCSRLRRGVLYRVASEIGATRIALGHHRDDMLETLFLNMFYNGTLKGMPPKLKSDDGSHVVIRPLAYVREADLARYAVEKDFPIIPCDLCGSQETLKRREVKALLAEWSRRHPGRIESIAGAMSRVVPSHLMDRERFDFESLSGAAPGDLAFDDEPCATPVPRGHAFVLDDPHE